jgi:hypothetical protein
MCVCVRARPIFMYSDYTPAVEMFSAFLFTRVNSPGAGKQAALGLLLFSNALSLLLRVCPPTFWPLLVLNLYSVVLITRARSPPP